MSSDNKVVASSFVLLIAGECPVVMSILQVADSVMGEMGKKGAERNCYPPYQT